MASQMTRKKMNPKRFKILRSDASVESATLTITKISGLPRNSIKLVYPSGRKARSDSTIGALVKQWDISGQ